MVDTNESGYIFIFMKKHELKQLISEVINEFNHEMERDRLVGFVLSDLKYSKTRSSPVWSFTVTEWNTACKKRGIKFPKEELDLLVADDIVSQHGASDTYVYNTKLW